MKKSLTIMALLLSVAVIISRARAQTSSDLVRAPQAFPERFALRVGIVAERYLGTVLESGLTTDVGVRLQILFPGAND
jgi:hypothetical protein